jgi:hypothetical protein
MMDTKPPKIEVLKMILGRFQSQRRLEEAVIVQRLIDKELSKPEKYRRVIPRFLIDNKNYQ